MPPFVSEEEETFEVLVTGFGPFRDYKENPSWLAVRPLNNEVIPLEQQDEPIPAPPDGSQLVPAPWKRIHITTLEVPVVYQSVLDIVPGLHQKPPIFPKDTQGLDDSPLKGFDMIFHIGVAGRGPLRVERVGHKLGYQMKDATGQLAPIVEVQPTDFNRNRDGSGYLGAVNMEMLAMDSMDAPAADGPTRPNRGFGVGYEKFPEELFTEIDVAGVVQTLKRDGIEQIYTSMDAGHYLCDFIYYCSLAESRRSAYEKGRAFAFERGTTQVLFMHCPPVSQPLSTEQVTEAIRRIIIILASSPSTVQ